MVASSPWRGGGWARRSFSGCSHGRAYPQAQEATSVRRVVSMRPPKASALCGEPLVEPETDALDAPGQELCTKGHSPNRQLVAFSGMVVARSERERDGSGRSKHPAWRASPVRRGPTSRWPRCAATRPWPEPHRRMRAAIGTVGKHLARNIRRDLFGKVTP